MTVEMTVRCPHCGKVNELASGITAAVPDAGSIALCISCGHWSVYENDFIGLRQRIPTEAEWQSMQQDETVQKLTWAWQATAGKHR